VKSAAPLWSLVGPLGLPQWRRGRNPILSQCRKILPDTHVANAGLQLCSGGTEALGLGPVAEIITIPSYPGEPSPFVERFPNPAHDGIEARI
jgi:hypothetical protein